MAQQRYLIVKDDPKAVGAEAFRTLRTNLQFTSPDRELRTLLVTSAGPDEGKSTVVANLAVAWAQTGQRVILVGCDLRKPVLHRIFGIPNAPGLTSLLTGQAELDSVILDSGIENLEVIPSGPIPPNPAELLQSKVMTEIIELLKERSDIVIFDAPPIVAVTDAAVLASQMDGTLLVISAHSVPRDMALHAKALLEQANARLLGVVLNRVRPQDQRGYEYYYYYYHTDEELADD
ncbi:MAG: CpsD/CapB family tyrosine-protein kinase [Firmicutes bacterium]|jgi:capsular exopolysaccharide synthesis family protein|nr:CpsD/CapB family tyrosine-protein kinase [Bacillota bacterium]